VAAGLLLALAYTGVGVIYALVFKRYIPAAFSSVLTGFTCWLLGGALGPVPTDDSLLADIAPWIPTRHAIAVFRDAMVWRDPLQLTGHLASLTGLLALIALAAALSLRWGFQLE
jgi:ABC-type polysaccharide/polyol phosphate export permease